MKSLCIILLLFASSYLNAQEEFSYTEIGLDPKYIVTEIDSFDQKKLYSKSIKWIKNFYKNPEEVINTKSENDFIRITGISKNVVTSGSILFDIKYTIKLSFKDGRYKFEPIEIQCKANSSYSSGWLPFSLDDGSLYFKNGKPIKKFESYVYEIPAALDKLNQNLKTYLKSDEDEW